MQVNLASFFPHSKFLDSVIFIYNHMVMDLFSAGQNKQSLDAIFSALADPTRRAILSRLVSGQASVSEIAEPFNVSQPAVSRHLKVLERAGLIERDVDEQRRPARLAENSLNEAISWLNDFDLYMQGSLEQLDYVLEEMKKNGRDNSK